MERYSLYIDHQLVSQLIRQLENIVKVCHSELDQEYETYQLRTSIYEEFVFHITSLFNIRYSLKTQNNELKDDQLKKFYELSTKLEGIKGQIKYEDLQYPDQKIKKGRPSKNQKAEEKLVQWIQNKIKTEGQLKFQKKQLDLTYQSFTQQKNKKILPVGTYLRIFKNFNLTQISIIVRGNQKTHKDIVQKKTSSALNKNDDDSQIIKGQYVSESQVQSVLDVQINHYGQNRFKNDISKGYKRNLRSAVDSYSKKRIKSEKQNGKAKNFSKFFDQTSDKGEESQWNHILSMSEDGFDEIDKKNEIYENSRSFQSKENQLKVEQFIK